MKKFLLFLFGAGFLSFLYAQDPFFEVMPPLHLSGNTYRICQVNFPGNYPGLATITRISSSQLILLENTGKGEFIIADSIPLGCDPNTLTGGKFGEENFLIVGGYMDGDPKPADSLIYFSYLGQGNYTRHYFSHVENPVDMMWFNIADQRFLAVVNYTAAGFVSLFRFDETEKLIFTDSAPVGIFPNSIALVQNDPSKGAILITTNRNSQSLQPLTVDPSGNLSVGDALVVNFYPVEVTAFNYLKSGKPGFAVIGNTPDTLAIFYLDDSGTIQSIQGVSLPFKPTAIATADIDADGIDDIGIAGNTLQYQQNQILICLVTPDGNIKFHSTYDTPSGPQDLLFSLLNNDPYPDVATANFYGRSVTVGLHNGNVVSLDDRRVPLAEGYELFQNYPNPFNPITFIPYELKQKARVHLQVFDIQGKLVMESDRGIQDPGQYRIQLETTGWTAGVYFYRLVINTEAGVSRKMVLLK